MRAFLILCSCVLLQACGLSDYSFRPLIYDFGASPSQVDYGQTTTLSWKLGGRVTSLTLNGESVLGTTSTQVTPLRRQAFVLAASSSLIPSSTEQIIVAARGLDLLAGNTDGRGNANGIGSGARFAFPIGMAVDGSRNIYVADSRNHLIRKITPTGDVSTLAGLGMAGSNDGSANLARFNQPNGVAVDSAGNVYVADTANSTIRRITSAGVVSTLAGLAGVAGTTDTPARFNWPDGLAVDNSGIVYVADTSNHTIRRISPSGSVSTLAGAPGQPGSTDDIGSNARFNYPSGITVDNARSVLYVAEWGNNAIRRVTFSGDVRTVAGAPGMPPGSADGTGSAARFNFPVAVAPDPAGDILVADAANHTLRRVTPAGDVTTVAGLAGTPGSANGLGVDARFYVPHGVTVDALGIVYVADHLNCTIRRITPAGMVATLAGVAGNGTNDGSGATARFTSPSGVAVDRSGNAYVSDTGNQTIRKISPTGVVSTFAGLPGVFGNDDGTGSAARFGSPTGIAIDTAGALYVADTDNHLIRKVTSGGVVSTLAGSPGLPPGGVDGTGTAARFASPQGVAVDSTGDLYVADTDNHSIRRVTATGVVSTFAGTLGQLGNTDGTGNAARFFSPAGVAVDGSGNIYVADTGNHTLRKITPGGVVSTLAGSPGIIGIADGRGVDARFNFPVNVTVDSSGNVYVTDNENHTVRKVTPAGVVTTIAGTVRSGWVARGPLPGTLSFPQGIALTPPPAGDLLVTTSNGVIQITAF